MPSQTHWNPPTTGTESASVDPGTTTCITFGFPGSGGTTTTTTYPSYPTITKTWRKLHQMKEREKCIMYHGYPTTSLLEYVLGGYSWTANSDRWRSLPPIRRNMNLKRGLEYDGLLSALFTNLRTHGSGTITAVSPARSAVAPTVPRRWYIAGANRGNAAANVDRSALLEAIADAAIGR